MDKEKEIRRKKNILFQIYEAIAKKNVLGMTERLEKANEKLSKERSKLVESETTYKSMETTYEATHRQFSEIETELHRATSVSTNIPAICLTIALFSLFYINMMSCA